MTVALKLCKSYNFLLDKIIVLRILIYKVL